MLVRPDPQLLGAGARLDVLERRDEAGLENVELARDMKSGNVDRPPEIMPSAEVVLCRVADDLVEEGLPGRELGGAGQGQPHPVGRSDEGRRGIAGRVEPAVARGRAL